MHTTSLATSNIIQDHYGDVCESAKKLRVLGHVLLIDRTTFPAWMTLPEPTKRGDTESRDSSLARLLIRTAELLDEHSNSSFNFSLKAFLVSSRVTFHTWNMLRLNGSVQQFLKFENGSLTVNLSFFAGFETRDDVDNEWLVTSKEGMIDGARGNVQTYVAKAVSQGLGTPADIAAATGINEERVRKALKLMRSKTEPCLRFNHATKVYQPTEYVRSTTKQEKAVIRVVTRVAVSRLMRSAMFYVNETYKRNGYEIRRLLDGSVGALDRETGLMHPGQADPTAWMPVAHDILSEKIIPVMKNLDGRVGKVRIIPTNWQRLFPWAPGICSEQNILPYIYGELQKLYTCT